MHTILLNYYTIGIIAILAAISPGPDFVIVTKHALTQNRRNALLASLGIGCGILIHTSYCVLGLAIILSQSLLLFSLIKYLGASYLIYLGIKSLFAKANKNPTINKVAQSAQQHSVSTASKAFMDGLLTNVLNPKCTLFMLSIFTLVIKPDIPHWIQATYGVEIGIITAGWFSLLSLGFTHSSIRKKISNIQHYVTKIIGVCLISVGIVIGLESHY